MNRVTLTTLILSCLAVLSGCGVPQTAVIDPAAAAEIAVASAVPPATAVPTAELPAISVYELIDGEQVEVVAAASGTNSDGSVAVLDDSGLPAPVVSGGGDAGSGANSEAGNGLPTAIPTVEPPTLTPTATAIPPTPENTPTPVPTFTLPALPDTSTDDHYWLLRPIQEGGIVWTEKSYTYGGTKGNTLRTHHGVEFAVGYDTPILAAADGVVVTAGPDIGEDVVGPMPNFYGNVVVIRHDFLWEDEPVFTLYAHLGTINVTKGQRVKSGDFIALSGATGIADGAHMHFEVRQGSNNYGSTRNPLLWLWPFPDDGTIAGQVTWANGTLADGAPVNYRRIDGGDSRVFLTTSYADDAVNGDSVWQENYAADDVDAGFYEVYVKVGAKKYSQEVWVYPRRTTFVDIVIGD